MIVLGIHHGHDSSAALIVDGKIIADVAEERFDRIKHSPNLPFRSIEYCLKAGGIKMEQVDIVALSSLEDDQELKLLFDGIYPVQVPENKNEGVKVILKKILGKESEESTSLKTFKQREVPIYIKKFKISGKTKVVKVDHHQSHAASAYYTSGTRDKQLVVTMDGVGDGTSISIWRGENGKLTCLKRFSHTASLGWFYSNVTEGIGWIHGDGEGKTMGLDPYGKRGKIKGALEKFHPKFKNGDITYAHDFGELDIFSQSGYLQYHFRDAVEIQKLVEKYGREDVAAEAQQVLEDECFNIIFPWLEKENTQNLSCSGGIFLNVKLNQRIWETGKVKLHNIYGNPGDAGLSVGAALQAYYNANPTAPIYKMEHLFYGPEYTNEEIEPILKARNLKYKKVDDIEAYAAKLLSENKIIAWFQGRMESGPRALGNRSILMSANKSENKDVINARVKFREAFRPFCPSLSWEKREDYLENCRDEFFMITSFTCKAEKRSKIPAVVHADNTLRPQTVKKEHNARYWNLLNEFGKITGEYLLMNTSFNVMGEPMINHPREAIRCFYDNGIDHLILGNFVLSKEV